MTFTLISEYAEAAPRVADTNTPNLWASCSLFSFLLSGGKAARKASRRQSCSPTEPILQRKDLSDERQFEGRSEVVQSWLSASLCTASATSWSIELTMTESLAHWNMPTALQDGDWSLRDRHDTLEAIFKLSS
ncbi:hypothetical protein C0Q70_20422 [Pomacea canaliculata]|uniref:Uncharacterized protein n=1 Tax=Pomacea canaliculata TaxID=400727 RepID=A0A2T7NFH4_POMCA|nr:hypothetical protein C0Q70_20422 [Pomacea canaliculata]